MKKAFFIILTVLCMALLQVSCVPLLEPWEKIQPEPEPEPEPEPDPDPTPTPTPGPTPAPTPVQVKSAHSAAYVFSDSTFPFKFLEFSSDKRFIAERRAGGGANSYLYGTYGISDSKLVLDGVGAFSIVRTGSSAEIEFAPESGAAWSGKATVKWPASSASSASEMFKAWKIAKTRISFSEGLKINADLNGCDLGALAEMLKKLGVKTDDKLKGVNIDDVVFTWGSMLLRCSNGTNYYASCNYANYASDGSFAFTLGNFISGFSGGDGNGKVVVSGNVRMLTLELAFARNDKKYKGSFTFVLNP